MQFSACTCMHAKWLQLCPILCDSVSVTPPRFSVHRKPQARRLEWVVCPPALQADSLPPSCWGSPKYNECFRSIIPVTIKWSIQLIIDLHAVYVAHHGEEYWTFNWKPRQTRRLISLTSGLPWPWTSWLTAFIKCPLAVYVYIPRSKK